ncbi:hypothetical protein H072_8334 [Dactylellina haptotyla CBS 200.50]|uniref:Uncharacterized protein n=1 Tax=Dactylellina haptotyla (strain CBS 200.50) TaxID=1284197 RepID=S8BF50_DACHA|nr:hypothetical protein H072_8334 [Dactylellina haptotyla CBS 200.50]
MSADPQELANMPELTEKDLKSILPRDDSFTPPRILILCPDKALAPYSASEPWYIFKQAGCVIEFATENGDVPKADQRMLERSKFRDFIGAGLEHIERFYAMAGSDEYLSPRKWSDPSFSLLVYDAVYLTTGFDTRMRQFVESESLHKLMASYFPLSKRRTIVHRSPTFSDKIKRRSTVLPNPEAHLPTVITDKQKDELDHLEGPRKVVAAMGKGVLVLTMSNIVDSLTEEERKSAEEECTIRLDALAEQKKKEEEEAKQKKAHRRSTSLAMKIKPLQRSNTTGSLFKSTKDMPSTSEKHSKTPTPATCRSVIHGVETTTAPTWLENVGTTISAVHGFKNMFKTYQKSTQDQVVEAVGNPALFHAGPPNMKPFTHSASTHHYVSARYPIDSRLTSLHVLEEIALARKEWGKVSVQ